MVCYVCLFLSVCFFICRFVYMSVGLLLCLCTCFSLFLFACLSVCSPYCVLLFCFCFDLLFFRLSVCLSVSSTCGLVDWSPMGHNRAFYWLFCRSICCQTAAINWTNKRRLPLRITRKKYSPFFSQLYFEAPIFQTT